MTREGVGGVVDGWGADQEREGVCLGKGRESGGAEGVWQLIWARQEAVIFNLGFHIEPT